MSESVNSVYVIPSCVVTRNLHCLCASLTIHPCSSRHLLPTNKEKFLEEGGLFEKVIEDIQQRVRQSPNTIPILNISRDDRTPMLAKRRHKEEADRKWEETKRNKGHPEYNTEQEVIVTEYADKGRNLEGSSRVVQALMAVQAGNRRRSAVCCGIARTTRIRELGSARRG